MANYSIKEQPALTENEGGNTIPSGTLIAAGYSVLQSAKGWS